jgi:hypothetical protein
MKQGERISRIDAIPFMFPAALCSFSTAELFHSALLAAYLTTHVPVGDKFWFVSHWFVANDTVCSNTITHAPI